MARTFLLGLALLTVTACVNAAAQPAAKGPIVIWLEGESPSRASFEYEVQSWGPVFSDGKWLHVGLGKDQVPDPMPEGGMALSYEANAPMAGSYELWLRLGFEGVRAPLQWRVNGGEWTRFGPEDLTANLLEIGVWAEVGWGKLGSVDLREGRNALDIRCVEPGRDGRLIIALDCIAFVEGQGSFTPDGLLRPGQQYDAEIDRRAAEQVFRLPARGADATRPELPLDGPWQVARYDDPDMDKDTYEPVKALPRPEEYELKWRGIEVPGDARSRADLKFGHRLLYRARVEVPAEFEGQGFHLHFSGTNWIAGVFVNGQYVGGRQSVLVPWDVDVTRAVRPGEVNTVTIGIKSSWYALEPGENETIDHLRNRPYEGDFKENYRFVDAIYPSTKGEGDGLAVGIVNPVKLVATGPAYTSDIFIRTSVADRRLDADVTVTNATGEAADVSVLCEAVNERTGQVEKAFGPADVAVPAGGSEVVSLGGAWADPKLWWPEDHPDLYVMRTTVSRGGKPIDVQEELFGFREVSIEGKDFLLNGIAWHFWNWVDVGHVETQEQWLESYHAHKDRFHRIGSDSDGLWGCRERALDFFDRYGVPGRLSTCIDGMFITHNLANPLVWENFKNHVRQVVTAYRNHPSVMMYSLGNEMIFITARLAYNAQDNLKWMAKAQELSDLARELDPTRASFEDGAGDLNRRGEINCQHYTWPEGSSVPTESYSYGLREGEWVPTGTWDRSMDQYAWDGKRPLVQGEVFYYAGNVSAMAWVGGPDVYRGKSHANEAAARYARIGVEGARWQGVTAICPWVGALPEALVSFEPRAAFVREYNSCFYPGSTMQRTIKVFNDGHLDDALTLKWKVVLDGREAAAGEKTYQVPPGRAEQDSLEAQLPAVKARADGELEIELYARGERVFHDTRPVSVLPPLGRIDGLDADGLCVYDPEGTVNAWLDGIGQPHTAVKALDGLPDAAKVLLIGSSALSEENKDAEAQAIRTFVQAGKTAILLRQQHALEGDDLPVSGVHLAGQRPDEAPRPEFRAAGGQSGRIAFPVALAHPVLDGLKERDFFTWAGDETSFGLSYASAGSGAISLVQAGHELGLAPMLEIPVGRGSYLLCQMLVAEKLGVEPVADRLLHNMLAWAAQKAEAKPGKTVAYLADDGQLGAFLDQVGVKCDRAADLDAALAREANVRIVRATPQALAGLNERKQEVLSFCNDGGWLMLVGLDEEGLDAFNELVGFRHRIRPFRREAVVLQARADPLLLGLSDRDVNMVSNEVLAPWAHLFWVSDRTFTSVVDGREIASFGKVGNEYLTKLTNGLTNEDFWQYICYFGEGEQPPQVDFLYDRPETFTHMDIWGSGSYYFAKDIEVIFDGDEATAVPFAMAPITGKQEINFEPRTASTVTIRIKSFHPGTSDKKLVGIDNVELFRRVPDDFDGRVVLLTKPGGLVKYPLGKGGIVLNQVDYAREDTEENVQKKVAIYSNVLRNMGAAFGQ